MFQLPESDNTQIISEVWDTICITVISGCKTICLGLFSGFAHWPEPPASSALQRRLCLPCRLAHEAAGDSAFQPLSGLQILLKSAAASPRDAASLTGGCACGAAAGCFSSLAAPPSPSPLSPLVLLPTQPPPATVMLPLLASLCLSPPPTCPPPLSVLSMPPNPASPPSAPTQVVVMLPPAPGPPAFPLLLLPPPPPQHIETPTMLLLASSRPPPGCCVSATLAASARRYACAAVPPCSSMFERADPAAGAAEAACAATSAVFTAAADCADARTVSTACARFNVASRSAPANVAAVDADCNAAVVITRADVSAALAAAAFDANLAVAAASAIAARAVLRRSRPSVGDVCDSASRAFTSIARDRMLSLRDSLLEINSGVLRAAFALTRLATTRRGEAALPPNVLVLPLSKGCTVRSRSLLQHFE